MEMSNWLILEWQLHWPTLRVMLLWVHPIGVGSLMLFHKKWTMKQDIQEGKKNPIHDPYWLSLIQYVFIFIFISRICSGSWDYRIIWRHVYFWCLVKEKSFFWMTTVIMRLLNCLKFEQFFSFSFIYLFNFFLPYQGALAAPSLSFWLDIHLTLIYHQCLLYFA